MDDFMKNDYYETQKTKKLIASTPQIYKSYEGHSQQINSVSYEPKTRRNQVASASNDGIVYVWSLQDKQKPFKFIGHQGPVLDVKFSPDGKIIASSGQDGQIRLLYNFRSNEIQSKCKVLINHDAPINNLDFSNNGELLLSASTDKTAKCWRVANENNFLKGKAELLFSLEHKSPVNSAQFSPDSQLIVTCSDDKMIKMWDVDTEKQISIFVFYDYHSDRITSTQFTPDGSCIASGSEDKTIKLFDIRNPNLIQHYEAGSSVNKVCFHPKGNFLLSAQQDGLIKIWDMRKGDAHERQSVNGISFNSKGDYFVTGGNNKLVNVWNSNFEKQQNTQEKEKMSINNLSPIKQEETGMIKSPTYDNSVLTKSFQNSVKKQNKENNAKNKSINEEKQQAKNNNLEEKLMDPLNMIMAQLGQISQQMANLDQKIVKNENSVKNILQCDAIKKLTKNNYIQ